jgi:hypothetical protein
MEREPATGVYGAVNARERAGGAKGVRVLPLG